MKPTNSEQDSSKHTRKYWRLLSGRRILLSVMDSYGLAINSVREDCRTKAAKRRLFRGANGMIRHISRLALRIALLDGLCDKPQTRWFKGWRQFRLRRL